MGFPILIEKWVKFLSDPLVSLKYFNIKKVLLFEHQDNFPVWVFLIPQGKVTFKK